MSQKKGRFMKKPSKQIPLFKPEKEERAFWDKNVSSGYFDLSKALRVTMPNLKPSTAFISLNASR